LKNILEFASAKKSTQKISMVTCYDYLFAKIVEESLVDVILVGDSVSMVVHGYPDTTHADMNMMELHTRAVRKGAPSKFIVGDMPFGSFHQGKYHTFKNAAALIRAGANAVKIENVISFEKDIEHLVRCGIPVMGHLGLTPQSLNQLGGFKVQGKTHSAITQLKNDAKKLQELGAFSLVLECIPSQVAAEITSHLAIPTIGIGAGPNTDGQVLVIQDLLGIDGSEKRPRFVKRYSQLHQLSLSALNLFSQEVINKNFPTDKESYL
jgi:3-methyl-2-oxobutanoate hydroxymethyltransferase